MSDTPDTVVFNDADHSYIVNGVQYPSVTEILNSLACFDRIPRDVLERKRQIGKAVHRAIELHEQGQLDPDSIDDAVAPYLMSWIRFAATKNPRIVAAEEIVYSKIHRVAGRFDMIVEFPGDKNWWLLDAKCVAAMAPTTALQTAAYAHLWNENKAVKVTRRAGLQLQADGSLAKLYPYDGPTHRNDWLVFQMALNLDRWMKNHAR